MLSKKNQRAIWLKPSDHGTVFGMRWHKKQVLGTKMCLIIADVYDLHLFLYLLGEHDDPSIYMKDLSFVYILWLLQHGCIDL